MNLLNIIAYADNIAENVSQTPNSPDIAIGIGNIFVTLIVGVLTCLVTWVVTKKTMQQRKLSYSINIYPMLSKPVAHNNMTDLEIKYKQKELVNPCLCTVDIVNTGNNAVENPPIKIKSNENIHIIPGYFEDIPNGYETKWSMSVEDVQCCKLSIEHINPKQIIKARFFLDEIPNEKIIFECPMADVHIQENNYDILNEKELKKHPKSHYILIIIAMFMFLTIPQWSMYINYLLYDFDIPLIPEGVITFIMMIPILTATFNLLGIKWLDNYMYKNKIMAMWIKSGLVGVVILLLICVTFNIVIVGFMSQVAATIIAAILLSLAIHFVMI